MGEPLGLCELDYKMGWSPESSHDNQLAVRAGYMYD